MRPTDGQSVGRSSQAHLVKFITNRIICRISMRSSTMIRQFIVFSLPAGFTCCSETIYGTSHQRTGLVYSPLSGDAAPTNFSW